MTDKIRVPIVDGLFYPDSAAPLRKAIEELSAASPEPRGRAFGFAAPHAAYERAGALMAAGFLSAADRRIKRAVILGPVHRDFTDEIILPESAFFKTPLGNLPVDTEGLESLLSCGTNFVRNDIPHLEEHCIEVLLPFLQFHFPDAAIIPVLVGKDTKSIVKSLGKALFVAFGEDFASTLFIVSTNFSGNAVSADARAEADAVIALALREDAEALIEAKVSRKFAACGIGCLAAFLSLPPAKPVRLIGRASTISDAEADKGVEYAALSAGP